ncbi:hypothetical protein WA026_023228 [Henosepilachna vigintioctopunctata]|uniref:C2H2-type domain-containing protein n=1 Tax=Henosepilachna vigintioctopunctata TaxID=420089 RepID=A0AAW1VJI0_9CUCU
MIFPRIHRCQNCSKTYRHQQSLHRHMKYECGKMPLFSCPVARYGPNNYECSTCGRSYKVARSLWRHQKYECQKEPCFGCTVCPYKAKHKASVIKHMCTVHPNKYFQTIREAT